jgi:hypothetical protein
MDLTQYRQQQAQRFYQQLTDAHHPIFLGWQAGDPPLPQIGGEPRGISGHPFQGDNAVQLMMAAQAQGFANPYWMTFDQAKACGGSIKRGEVGTKILSWIGNDSEYKPILMTVFNGDQLQGLTLPTHDTLTHEQTTARQAALDALLPPRKKAHTPAQYVARLRKVLCDHFPDEEHTEAQAQAILRREMALMTGCARLGLPRAVDPGIREVLEPYVQARPNWREIDAAIDDANRVLKEVGVKPMPFANVTKRVIEPDVAPASSPARARAPTVAKSAAMDRDADIPF